MKYWNGWTHYVNLGDVNRVYAPAGTPFVFWDDYDVGRFWGELCRWAPLLGCIRFTTDYPGDQFPGYTSTVRVVRNLMWEQPAAGVTPYNAHLWSDAQRSPFYTSPETLVLAIDPVITARNVIHEMCHLLLKPPLDQHNQTVGTVFLAPPPQDSTFTDFGRAALADGTASLAAGWRLVNSAWVQIPHPVSPDNPVPTHG